MYIAILLVVLILTNAVNWMIEPKKKELYSPWLVFSLFYFCYSAYPVVAYGELAMSFMVIQVSGLIGAYLGYFTAIKVQGGASKALVVHVLQPRYSEFVNIMLSLFSLFLMLVSLNYYMGGLLEGISEGYAHSLEGASQLSGVDALVGLVTLFAFPSLIIATSYCIKNRFVAYGIPALAGSLLILLGYRNQALAVMTGAALCAALRRGRINYPVAACLGALMLIVFTVVSYYRAFGLDRLDDFLYYIDRNGLVELASEGHEFGTAYNTFSLHESNPTWWRGYPCESYLRAIYSMVPRIIWQDRPETLGGLFSATFASRSGLGLGFSVNLESYINFGIFGPFIVCIVFGFLLGLTYVRSVVRLNIFGLAFYSCCVYMLVNFNRMDTQGVVKIFIIRMLFLYIAYRLVVKAALRRNVVA